MNVEQVEEIVLKIRIAYPQAAREIPIDKMLDLYEEHLLDQDFDKVMRVLNDHIKKSKYYPSISELIVNDKRWGTPVVIEEAPEKTPEEIAEIKRIIAEGKANLIKILNKQGGE